ncbi:MAG: hypothetical protein ACRD4Y_04820, partial [Candidatus Acidiferrales bacterium]
SKITGGALKSAMKVAGIFNKKASEAMKPVVITHYVKGGRIRTDDADGKIEIIDTDGGLIIEIDPKTSTYSEITFEQMKASMLQAQEKMKEDPRTKDVKADVNVKINVTPGTGTREILGQTTHETKVQMEMEFQAQDTSQGARPGGAASGTMVTTADMWISPSVTGYQEFAEAYARMAKQINWVPPSNIHVDPRVSQSLDEMKKNSADFKGLPLLQYLTMSMENPQGSSGDAARNSESSNPAASSSDSSANSDNTPTSMSGALTKGLGGLFGRKKKKEEAEDQNSQNAAPPSTPGALMEMTTEVNSFSGDSLDSSLFEVPAGYTRVARNPDQVLGEAPAKK